MELIKINKTKARRLYSAGTTIYIVPCKVRPDFDGPWITPFELQYTDAMKQQDVDFPTLAFENTFDSRINNFQYYNCNSELGDYTHFYIEK